MGKINIMKLKALTATVSGFNKASVIQAATNYAKSEGYEFWGDAHKRFNFLKWKWEYKIDLIKPINFKIIPENDD